MLFTGSVTQTVILSEVEKELRVGERGMVKIKFMTEPQWLRVTWTILIRQTDTKCVGKIMSLCQDL